MTASASNSALQPALWRKQLFADARDNIYMTRFIGDGPENMIQELTDLKATPGVNISFGVGIKLTVTGGVTADSTLEASEVQMTDYDEDVAIDQLRNAVILTGRMDEKKNVYNMRTSAKDRLSDWVAERIDYEILNKLCGNASATFANTPTAAGSTRACWAGGQTAIGNITTANKMDCKLLDKARQIAKLASPMVRPLKIKGKEYYVAILHPYDAANLRIDPVWHQAQREANVRGEENPIFSGAMGIYNGIVIHEHEYVYSTTDGSGSANIARNILCGQQAGVIAWGANVNWVEKSFDYGNQWGISCGMIFGVIKPLFNTVDYGVVTMFAYSAALSTA